SRLEQAALMNRSPENLATLANFVAFPTAGKKATREAQQRALALVQEANQKNSRPDAADLFLTAQIAGDLDNESEFRKAARQMMESFPDLAESHYLNAIRASSDEQWTEAENEIRRAGELGLPPDLVQRFLDSGVQRRASEWRYARYGIYVVAAWMAGLALLFVFGKALSRLTLQSIEQRSD